MKTAYVFMVCFVVIASTYNIPKVKKSIEDINRYSNVPDVLKKSISKRQVMTDAYTRQQSTGLQNSNSRMALLPPTGSLSDGFLYSFRPSEFPKRNQASRKRPVSFRTNK